MGTSVYHDLWLARREGAALFGWGTTFTGPQATRVDQTSTNDRHHFVGWPAGWVVKKSVGCGNSYGRLYLEVKTTYKWFEFISNATTDLAFWNSGTPNIPLTWGPIMSVNTPVIYDPVSFAGGDGHVYSGFSWYSNDMNVSNPGNPYYATGTADFSGTTNSGFNPGYQTGGYDAYLYNDADWEIYYGDFTGKMTPSDLFSHFEGLGMVTTSNTTTTCYQHLPGSSHWDRSSAVAISNVGAGGYAYNWDGFDYFGEIIGTFLMDEDWTATGRLENLTCKFRWRYDPQSTEGCKWWSGKVVSAKVFYKKSLVTKTDGPDGVFYSLGSWVSGGDSTQSLTLQDSYTDAYVASEVTMPTEEGYVYVIDDIEILSVT